jgi:hypothetical protein
VQRLIASCLNDACRHQALIDVSSNPRQPSVDDESQEIEIDWLGDVVIGSELASFEAL